MLTCVICSKLFSPKKQFVSRIELGRRKHAFHLFCQLLGISEEQADTFVQAYDFKKEVPYCKMCVSFSTNLATHAKSRDKLEADILALQASVCDKLRQLAESSNEIDKVLRQVRRSMSVKNHVILMDGGEEVEADVRSEGFRKLIWELSVSPLQDESDETPNLILEKTKHRRNRRTKKYGPHELIVGYPTNFAIPDDTVKITVAELKIKEEHVDSDDGMSYRASASGSGLVLSEENEGDEAEVDCKVFGDYYLSSEEDGDQVSSNDNEDSLGILPEIEVEANSFCVTEIFTNDIKDEDSAPSRKTAALHIKPPRRKQIHFYSKSDDDLEFEEDDVKDRDWVDEDSLLRTDVKRKRRPRRKNNHKGPVTQKSFAGSTAGLNEYLETIETLENNMLSYKGIEVIAHQGNVYECGKCAKTCITLLEQPVLSTNLNIRRHIQEKHLGGYQCGLCSKDPYLNFRSYYYHYQSHLKPSVKCDICGKPMPFTLKKDALKLHIWTHKNDVEKEEATKSGNEVNLLVIKPRPQVRNYQCTQCGKCFITVKTLKIHEEIHRDKRERAKEKVPCHICGRMIYPHLVQAHLTCAHSNKSPLLKLRHACSICSGRFTTPTLLKLHMRRAHTGERPFSCSICSRSFIGKSMLAIHESIHSDERPFECTHCPAKFKRQSHLKRHEKSRCKISHAKRPRSAIN